MNRPPYLLFLICMNTFSLCGCISRPAVQGALPDNGGIASDAVMLRGIAALRIENPEIYEKFFRRQYLPVGFVSSINLRLDQSISIQLPLGVDQREYIGIDFIVFRKVKNSDIFVCKVTGSEINGINILCRLKSLNTEVPQVGDLAQATH